MLFFISASQTVNYSPQKSGRNIPLNINLKLILNFCLYTLFFFAWEIHPYPSVNYIQMLKILSPVIFLTYEMVVKTIFIFCIILEPWMGGGVLNWIIHQDLDVSLC